MSRPWMPLYVGDFIRDTRHLSPVQGWGYLHLIMEYWTKGKLPDNEGGIRRIAGLTPQEWRWNRDEIAAMFGPDWSHKRIDAEIKKTEEIRAKRQIAGMRGGMVSRGRTNIQRHVTQAFARQGGEHSQSQREERKRLGENGTHVSTELLQRVGRWGQR